jgi:hypothetical protein
MTQSGRDRGRGVQVGTCACDLARSLLLAGTAARASRGIVQCSGGGLESPRLIRAGRAVLLAARTLCSMSGD